MNTIYRDFEAFKARLLTPQAALYECREAPDDDDAGPLAKSIERIGQLVKDGQTKLSERLDKLEEFQRDQTKQTERLETRIARPGAMTQHSLPGGADGASNVKWMVNGREVQVLRGPEQIRGHYRERGTDGAMVSVGELLRGVAGLASTPETRAVLSVGTDADGGYLVPTKLMGGVLEALVPQSSMLTAGAGILPLDTETTGAKSFTLAATDSVPTAAWRSENGAVSESSPGFRAVVMTPRSLSFFFKVSREWLADAVGTDAALTTAIAQAFARELDRTGLRGTGTAPEPRGILNTSGIIAVGNGANGASLATTKYANLHSGLQQILEANGPMPTAAIMSPRSLVTLGSLVDTTGQPLQVPPLLKDVRMLATSQVPNNLTVGTSTDCTEITLGDFTRVVMAMRERMSIQRLGELFAGNGQVAFMCHVRADIGVLYPKAFAVCTGVRA